MNRYSRNIQVLGADGQKRLSAAGIFIIGCGALGGQCAMLLAGAGVGTIGIADYDTVDISNLQRQLFFRESECGASKCNLLAARMRELNSEITVNEYPRFISEKCIGIFEDYDLIIDCTDNPATKYATDSLAFKLAKPAVIGGVAGWRGQVVAVNGKDSKHFHDFFPRPEGDVSMMPCEIEGVIGAASSTVASVMAAEAIQIVAGWGDSLYNQLWMIDLENHTTGYFGL